MNANNLLSRTPPRYWGYLALSLWGIAAIFLLRQDPYNLDEGAARCLLLIWSIVDQVASAVVTFGTPDLRLLLFVPMGILWTGNVFAAKIFSVLLMACSAWLLYLWERDRVNAECALLATGLLIISPIALEQIDTLASSIFLLLSFTMGAWLNETYRAQPRPFGGWYFAQLFVCALSVSLHPSGLAYPLALFLSWRNDPIDHKQQKYFFIGIGLTTLLTLLIKMGWHDQLWLQSPVKNLATILLGSTPDDGMSILRWVTGGALLALLVFVIFKQHRQLWSDFTGRILLFGLAIGTTACDSAWALISLAILLCFGFPLLLRPSISGGFARQRGATVLFIIILSTLFMRADRAHYELRKYGILSEQDQLIKTLAEEAESTRKANEESNSSNPPRLRVASQWPSRTMVACKCDTLPLPPAAKDPQSQLAMLHSVTHMLLDPQQPDNMMLSRNLAMLGGSMETVALQRNGVLLRINSQETTKSK
ncbi:MAG: hypothetical protein HY306_00905 [Nitrosomonadales bacterium]|nr:hypothetical protein [Nitrosomonadales bacterium]